MNSMQHRLSKSKSVALAVLLITSIGSESTMGLTIVQPRLSLTIQFERAGVALPEMERMRIAGLLDRVRREDWCPLRAIFVAGHADVGEGTSDVVLELARARAQYAKVLLVRYGSPTQLIFAEARGMRQPVVEQPSIFNARIELMFIGAPGSIDCDIPIEPGGVRAGEMRFPGGVHDPERRMPQRKNKSSARGSN